MNFWYYLLTNILEWWVRQYLPYFPTHEYWGLPSQVMLYGGEIFAILFVFLGQFISFGNLFRVLGIVLALEVWRNKGKILKVLALLRFML